jgi:hypothetical protein
MIAPRTRLSGDVERAPQQRLVVERSHHRR